MIEVVQAFDRAPITRLDSDDRARRSTASASISGVRSRAKAASH
jgi:hypothetical protein